MIERSEPSRVRWPTLIIDRFTQHLASAPAAQAKFLRKNGIRCIVSAANKGHALGADYAEALTKYSGFHQSLPTSTINELITRYEIEILPHRSDDLGAGRKQQFKRIRKYFGHFPPGDLQQSDVWTYYSTRKMTSQARHEVAALSAAMGGRSNGALSNSIHCSI